MTTQQRHLVFGAGLIGCYLGAAMRYRALSVDLLCRPSIAQKLQQGCKLTDYNDNLQQIEGLGFITHDNTKNAKYDVIWLTVKCTGVATAVEQLATFVGPETIIICCQNGLGSEQSVKSTFPNNQVLRAMVPFNVVEMAPGHFHRGSEGALTIERTDGLSAWLEKQIDDMRSDILPVAATDKMTELLWAKLQLNLGNSINALADIPVKAMLEQRQYRQVIAAMMRELLAVCDAMQLALPKVTALPAHWIPRVLTLPDFLFRLVANKMLAIDPNVRTSMWWDLSQGKKTEIDYLNGAIVAAAEPLDITCPANTKVIDLIKYQELSERGLESISAQNLFNIVLQSD